MSLRLGCIADDITGGSDLALALSRGGAKVAQIFGDPTDLDPPVDVDAAVVSLKVRTAPRSNAVASSLKSARTLKKWGASQLFFKYCSTFDSTSDGNIGPIAQALRDFTKADATPFAPSFPANGRTVYQGHLFVESELLSRSSMRAHPLTPMKESDLRKVLGAQTSSLNVGLIPLQIVERGYIAVQNAMADLCNEKKTPFMIVDAIAQTHLDTIAAACADLPLVTGGSALGESLARFHFRHRSLESSYQQPQTPQRNGRIAILSGSCSAASQEQAAHASKRIPTFTLSAQMAAMPETSAADLAARSMATDGDAVFISSTADPGAVAQVQETYGRQNIGSAFERLQGAVACALYSAGVRTFIIAGGETSGAVADALNLKMLTVGAEIAPGVPWMFDQSGRELVIAFKSGNFGGPDFYADALETIK